MWLLCGRLCFPVKFHRHWHAYSVDIDDGWAVVLPGEIKDHSMHKLFDVDKSTFVTSLYHVAKYLFCLFKKIQYLCHLIHFYTENEADGDTLINLTEAMVANMLPKMNLQVQFMRLQKKLASDDSHVDDISEPINEAPAQENVIESLVSSQQG